MLGRGLRELLILSITKNRSILNYRPFSIVSQTSKEVQCCLSGFSMYSARMDLELLLGSYQPKTIDPLLSSYSLDFLGAYYLVFNTNEDFTAFKSELSNRNELKKYIVRYPFVIDYNKHIKASHFNITNKTVKCEIDKSLSHDHLLFLFEDYKLARKSIHKCGINRENQFNKYLLHFRSPEEAELAFVEKNLKLVLGHNINLSVYQC